MSDPQAIIRNVGDKQIVIDPARDIFRYGANPLNYIFAPKTVAVIGATETPGSVGRTVLWNLISNPFGGVVFPVNPKRSSILGIKAYPNIAAVPEKVDLAVIVTQASFVPDIVAECVQAGVKGAIIISAGFKELGAPGEELERRILEHARKGHMRIIGPNCLGVMNPISGLNATFGGVMARPGNVAFISQSGALCTAVLDWSIRELVGFSAFVSIGSMLDVDFGDLIDYVGNDPRTQSIVIYMESIGNARDFLSAAREVALNKPIIVIKAGRTEAAAKAAASHTGSLTGSFEVLDAAFMRAGVLRVNSISELFNMAEVLGKQPRPKGPRLTILTNAGGPGVLATDALIVSGGQLADVSEKTFKELNDFLPPHWSRNNPIDILGDAGPDRYAQALEIAANDPNSDGLMVILTPQDMTDPTMTAEKLKPYAKIEGKPVIASWMGGPVVSAGNDVLNRVGIPTFNYPDTAARTFTYMWKYSDNLNHLYELPEHSEMDTGDMGAGREAAAAIIQSVRKQGRTTLTEYESKKLLEAYGIPTVPTEIATSAEQAADQAERMGYPVVLKLHSETITHKTDVGGVKLNLGNRDAVIDAFHAIQDAVTEKAGAQHFQGVATQKMIKMDGYEIIIGSSIDPQFGPVLLFGSGGQLVEVYKDRALALPPLNRTLARRKMERTKIYHALKGVRGRKPVDLVALERIMVRFSQLVVENPWICESDINPLLVSAEQIVAVDARFLLHPLDTPEDKLPQPAIRPYPSQYQSDAKLRDGSSVHLRPIRPEDEPLMVEFHKTLSDRSVLQRYTQPITLDQRITHQRLTRMCFIDYDREMALVVTNHKKPVPEIIAVGRLGRIRGTQDARFALLVSDAWQKHGIGKLLLARLLEIARKERNIQRVVGDMLPDNTGMIHICQKSGFLITKDEASGMLHAVIDVPNEISG
ncbi:MAG TPA: bifunctional acetate--CoA ligase family protein/GNAT family N-acetyltransferase [Kiritimatiellia bacterium]|nr:bifunctional acetate--CoA ligase family protein/GNAT family N-acetyltransferase [Kiritimatiellia bacterium]HMO99526.1 bifunctional acetate--CoA ligase family protein/GNAT family N-acetyltransferase [Kiritimatiellia bacterium]HMP97161.1 bifunctional acetate--CoA ligase family protein/GNAT family N-acetyltransferase [Kiritimatiellia bacterium]